MRYVARIVRGVTLIPFAAAICSAATPLRYELGFERWNTHLLDVTIHTSGLAGRVVLFSMAVWSPGSYVVRNFAAEVQDFRATDSAGRALSWHKTDAQSWEIDLNGATAAIIRYQVYANWLATVQYDDRHVAINGPDLWMYQVGAKERPITLTIDTSRLPADWKTATGLEKTGPTGFRAADYDWFADCPIEIAPFTEKDVTVLGTTYHFVVHDEMDKQDYTQFTRDVQHIVEDGLVPILAPAVGGPRPAPFAEYWFLIHVVHETGLAGGTEHLNSTKLNYTSDWGDSTPTTRGDMINVYDGKVLTAVHELFHAWNVKRLRPRSLGPFDYAQMVHTPSLWIAEGLTQYYTLVAALRAGFWTPQRYLGHVSRLISTVDAMPGRVERSIADASWDTWFGYIGGSALQGVTNLIPTNIINTNYSYYDAGEALGVLLDLEIRQHTNNQKSLDDWMRAMYEGYALPKPGFEEKDVVRVASEVAGTDMSDFFRRYLFGKDPLPYERDFGYAGIDVNRLSSSGGWSGLVLATMRDGQTVVSNIIPGSPAERDGLDRGDIVVALDDHALDRSGIEHTLSAHHPGDGVVFTVVHHEVLRPVSVTLALDPHPGYTLVPMTTRSPSQSEIYRGVLCIK